jgi:hypothetical protein
MKTKGLWMSLLLAALHCGGGERLAPSVAVAAPLSDASSRDTLDGDDGPADMRSVDTADATDGTSADADDEASVSYHACDETQSDAGTKGAMSAYADAFCGGPLDSMVVSLPAGRLFTTFPIIDSARELRRRAEVAFLGECMAWRQCMLSVRSLQTTVKNNADLKEYIRKNLGRQDLTADERALLKDSHAWAVRTLSRAPDEMRNHRAEGRRLCETLRKQYPKHQDQCLEDSL